MYSEYIAIILGQVACADGLIYSSGFENAWGSADLATADFPATVNALMLTRERRCSTVSERPYLRATTA